MLQEVFLHRVSFPFSLVYMHCGRYASSRHWSHPQLPGAACHPQEPITQASRSLFYACTVAGMLAGGTGVTPMYQVLHAILKNPSDKAQVRDRDCVQGAP